MPGLCSLISSASRQLNVIETFSSKRVFYTLLGVAVAKTSLRLYLLYRQKKVVHEYPTKESDKVIDSLYSDEQYEKSRQYALKKLNLKIFKSIFDCVHEGVILLTGAVPWLWTLSGIWADRLGLSATGGELSQSAIFLMIGGVYQFVISAPIDYYYHFVIEEQFDFNKQTKSFYAKDTIKSFFVQQTISIPINVALVKIIKSLDDDFLLYSFAFLSGSIMGVILIYPDFIAPIFDNYSQLEDCRLKTAVTELTEKVNFPNYKLYSVDGSRRSSHSNAYLVGLFKTRRIVLFDTLIAHLLPSFDHEKEDVSSKCSMDEVLAILSHELGHWKYMHNYKTVALVNANIFVQLIAYSLLRDKGVLYKAFGFANSTPILIGLWIILNYVLIPINEISELILNQFSRKHEFEADEYAASELKYGNDLIKALKKLDVDNLDFPFDDKLYAAFEISHPSLLQRIEAIQNAQRKID